MGDPMQEDLDSPWFPNSSHRRYHLLIFFHKKNGFGYIAQKAP